MKPAGQKFFSARVIDLWNGLDDASVSVENSKKLVKCVVGVFAEVLTQTVDHFNPLLC